MFKIDSQLINKCFCVLSQTPVDNDDDDDYLFPTTTSHLNTQAEGDTSLSALKDTGKEYR